MYFAHDPNQNFYYLGEAPPDSRTFHRCLVDADLKIVAADVETISLKERIAIGVSIATSPACAFYFPLFPTESAATPWHLLKDPSIINIYHNGIFDLGCMTEYNIKQDIQDTNIMSRLLCHKFNGLLDLSWLHQMEIHNVKDMLVEAGAKIMLELSEEVVARKCMQDSMATYKLFQIFLPQTNLEYYNVERATLPIMLKMSERGILIDHKVRQSIELQLEDDVDLYQGLCEEAEAFNPGSPQQVSYVLAKRGAYSVFGRLPFTRNKYGRPTANLSSDVDILEAMDDPLAQLVLEYRRRAKLLGTYIRPWANESRAYTRYHLDAITGRPSSTDRNMQNIPGIKSRLGINVRGFLIPDTGTWTDMDFSQLELRILAYVSQDREMLHIYETGGDIHQIAADFMGIDRNICKNVNFAMIYGGSDQTLAETAHIKSRTRATQLRNMWFQLFPQAGDYIQTVQHECHKVGRAQTIFGRQMRLPTEDEESYDGIERKAVNYPIQGSAADILKRSLIKCQDMDIALQVHDELLLDGIYLPDKFEALENIAPFRTPVEIHYLERWE